MAKGTGFGKTILIGDQFVLEEVPAIVSAISFETEATVERIAGDGWILEDNRIEVPGYKEKKKEQQARSIDRILEVMKIDVKKNPIKITYRRNIIGWKRGRRQRCQLRFACAGIERRIQFGLFDRGDQPGSLAGRISLSRGCEWS